MHITVYICCSYLRYGLLAARAEILKAGNANGYSNCILAGHQGMPAFFYPTVVLSCFLSASYMSKL
jgi:apyrase